MSVLLIGSLAGQTFVSMSGPPCSLYQRWQENTQARDRWQVGIEGYKSTWTDEHYCNWGEPERAPHRRYICARSVYMYVVRTAYQLRVFTCKLYGRAQYLRACAICVCTFSAHALYALCTTCSIRLHTRVLIWISEEKETEIAVLPRQRSLQKSDWPNRVSKTDV